jgi:hypothetical protein
MSTPGPSAGASPAGPRPEGAAAGTPGAAPGESGPRQDGAQYTQEDVDRLVAERLGSARAEAEAAATRAREQAEEQRLKAAGAWEKIAEERAGKVGELESINSQHEADLDAYREALRKHNKAQMADWPAVLRDAVPHGEDDDPLDVARAIESHRGVAKELAGGASGRGGVPGLGSAPRPAPGPDAAEQVDRYLRSRGTYHL